MYFPNLCFYSCCYACKKKKWEKCAGTWDYYGTCEDRLSCWVPKRRQSSLKHGYCIPKKIHSMSQTDPMRFKQKFLPKIEKKIMKKCNCNAI